MANNVADIFTRGLFEKRHQQDKGTFTLTKLPSDLSKFDLEELDVSQGTLHAIARRYMTKLYKEG